jgi:hypothetical protein
MPALRACGEAGWEPVTHATVQPAHVLIERFGGNPRSKDAAYFSLYNHSDRKAAATVTVDLAALGWQDAARTVTATERIGSRPVRVRRGEGAFRVTLDLGPREAGVLQLVR